MTRPTKSRRVSFKPGILYFKPAGIPVEDLEDVMLTLDEMEAVRLADLEGLYQEDAALRMNISRQTFANILTSAHRKTAEALVHGKALRIGGGSIEMQESPFFCPACRHAWSSPSDSGTPSRCPRCRHEHVHPDGEGQEAAGVRGCRQKKACCRRKQEEEK